jgi:hypothetical protein
MERFEIPPSPDVLTAVAGVQSGARRGSQFHLTTFRYGVTTPYFCSKEFEAQGTC